MPAKLLNKLLRKKVRDMDMNLVFWIWSTRTRTKVLVLVLVLTHFIQYSYSYSCLVKYSYSYSYSGFVYSPQPWLRPRQNGRYFSDDIFKCIFFNENIWISIKTLLEFVPEGPINNIPSLVQIMARRRPGDKPLSEPMPVKLSTHICVTRPQWVILPCVPSCQWVKPVCYRLITDVFMTVDMWCLWLIHTGLFQFLHILFFTCHTYVCICYLIIIQICT